MPGQWYMSNHDRTGGFLLLGAPFIDGLRPWTSAHGGLQSVPAQMRCPWLPRWLLPLHAMSLKCFIRWNWWQKNVRVHRQIIVSLMLNYTTWQWEMTLNWNHQGCWFPKFGSCFPLPWVHWKHSQFMMIKYHAATWSVNFLRPHGLRKVAQSAGLEANSSTWNRWNRWILERYAMVRLLHAFGRCWWSRLLATKWQQQGRWWAWGPRTGEQRSEWSEVLLGFLSNIRPDIWYKDLLEDSDTHPMNVYGTKVCIFKKNPDLWLPLCQQTGVPQVFACSEAPPTWSKACFVMFISWLWSPLKLLRGRPPRTRYNRTS